MDIKRRPFQGVLNILNFNRHFYYYGIAVLAGLLAICFWLKLPSIILILLILGFAYGLLMPLIVSAYVYDFSNYYSLNWLDKIIHKDSQTTNVANINAGFDETSYLIKNKYENFELSVFDFYDDELHTEQAIIRARKVSLTYPNTRQIKTHSIPLDDNSMKYVFLLSTAHEIRDFEEKVAFLKECKRVCATDGKIIMVEHLRDFPNFLAFSIGYFHFFSKNTWKKAYNTAGFQKINETKFTPFMSIFECIP